MVEFSGNISEDIQKKVIKKRDSFIGKLIFIFSIIILLICIVWFFCTADKDIAKILILYVPILFVISLLILFSKPNIRINWNHWVQIDNNEIKYDLHTPLYNKPGCKPISKVKIIIDDIDCYYIIFRYGDITNCLICQKNLIIKGTLEEFEKIFIDNGIKIVRKEERKK